MREDWLSRMYNNTKAKKAVRDLGVGDFKEAFDVLAVSPSIRLHRLKGISKCYCC